MKWLVFLVEEQSMPKQNKFGTKIAPKQNLFCGYWNACYFAKA